MSRRLAEFRQNVDKLKKLRPVAFPVSVRTVDRVNKNEWCNVKLFKSPRRTFQLLIERTLEAFMIDMLVHEWAHLRNWSHLDDRHENTFAQWHGPSWGVHYADCHVCVYDEEW